MSIELLGLARYKRNKLEKIFYLNDGKNRRKFIQEV